MVSFSARDLTQLAIRSIIYALTVQVGEATIRQIGNWRKARKDKKSRIQE